jgi:haloalkane dehalogenase
VGASDWFAELWDRRDVLRDKPVQLVWGMQDPTFSPDELARFLELWPDAAVERMPGVGHFPQEEAPDAAVATLRRFLIDGRPLATSSP